MFRKRQKKEFPPGTFIPTPARICAIIHLCLAFVVILWNASQPFTGALFQLKSQLVLYDDVMGIHYSEKLSIEVQDRLKRNAERFAALPTFEQNRLNEEVQLIQRKLQRPFFNKLQDTLVLFFFNISSYELVWLLLSVILPILLLKRVEGSVQALWFLPLLTVCYAAENRYYGAENLPSLDYALFPSEQRLIAKHLEGPLSIDVLEQYGQIKHAWQRYLIIEWAKQTPSTNDQTFQMQVEEGEFAFNLKRLELRSLNAKSKTKTSIPLPFKPTKQSVPLLALYFFWNVLFAFIAWKHCRLTGYAQEF